jgi:hypothetical protein
MIKDATSLMINYFLKNIYNFNLILNEILIVNARTYIKN